MKILYYIFIISLILFEGCSGCSKSGRRKISNNANSNQNNNVGVRQSGSKTIIKMEKSNGVYEIPTEINGVPMHFIFDTGAGLISISETEATFLYKQGKLDRNDIIGKANFIDANGDVSEGTIINLKSVRLGSRLLENVQASVVHNLSAPLLMGQSALEKFGKISIDYQRGEISFE